MPKIHLNVSFVANPPKPKDGLKVDYFDTAVPGFHLEVRATGKCTYYQRYRDKSGRLRQVRIGPTDSLTLEEARQRGRYIRSQAVLGLDPAAEIDKIKNSMTFKEFIADRYLPYIKLHKKSWRHDEKVINYYLFKLWGTYKLNDISKQEIEVFQATLIRKGKKAGTVNRHMSLVKYIFSLAAKWECIEVNPCLNISRIPDNGVIGRYLSDDELQRLFMAMDASKSSVVADILAFLIYTGARKSEALHARWADIDLERGVWTIPAEISKSGKPRHVPLSKPALEMLRERRKSCLTYVFPSPRTGKPLVHIQFTWEKIRDAANLPDLRIHDLRHNFASMLISCGRSLCEVQKLLGHADAKMTQRYAHLTQDRLREATEAVAELVEKISK